MIQVGIPAQQALQGRRQPTVFYVLPVDTAQEAALRVSALVIVPLVGTPQARLAQVQQRRTALRAMLADMEVLVVLPVSARTRVRLDGFPPLQRLQPWQLTALAVLQALT